MKKVLISVIVLLFGTISVYSLTNNFNIDSSKLSISANNKENSILDSFNDEYSLSYAITSNNSDIEKEITELTKKTTYLLLGDFGGVEENSEKYYKRHQDYLNMGSYNYFPRDENSESGYDESIPNYFYANVSEFAVPTMFFTFDKLDINYSSYGDIRITVNDNLIISSVSIPNIKMKVENQENPRQYDIYETDMVITYYYLKVGDQYTLAYLYAEYDDEFDDYFTELENNENKGTLQMALSYDSNLREIYDYSKLDAINDASINNIYNKNKDNVVILNAYYNNYSVVTANGFFINDGLIVTTWHFMEKALIKAQYITAKDGFGNSFTIDGILTANPDTDIVVIKLKEQVGRKVNLGDSAKLAIEDPVFSINSKTGVGLTLQKGIVLSNDGYIQSAIVLTDTDEGSPLFDKDGNVVGINTAKQVNTSMSLAVNSNILKEVQNKFNNKDFSSFEPIKFEKLKENFYYVKINEEIVENSIPENKWKIYSKIGNIEDNIKLELIKASYEDGIVSLRYQNNISDYISSMQFASELKQQLIKDGFVEELNESKKSIYKNSEYKIIIMDEFNYLIVLMVKL